MLFLINLLLIFNKKNLYRCNYYFYKILGKVSYFLGLKLKKILLTKIQEITAISVITFQYDRKINFWKYQLFFHNTFNNFFIK